MTDELSLSVRVGLWMLKQHRQHTDAFRRLGTVLLVLFLVGAGVLLVWLYAELWLAFPFRTGVVTGIAVLMVISFVIAKAIDDANEHEAIEQALDQELFPLVFTRTTNQEAYDDLVAAVNRALGDERMVTAFMNAPNQMLPDRMSLVQYWRQNPDAAMEYLEELAQEGLKVNEITEVPRWQPTE